MPSRKKKTPEVKGAAGNVPAAALDPSASDGNPVARDGARKRRDPNEASAVVGIGASAGGIAPLQQFFEEMPAESGLAFVVVMHLSPEHESNLAAILQHKTRMRVTQVSESVRVRPNEVYVIPPNKQLKFEDSTLTLVEPQQAIGRRVTIDLFFRTLAQSYAQRAVSIILSGTDSDGVIGLKHIRAQGGVTVAQDPREAEHDSMPLNAIASGMVDWVLPVAQMPGRLMDFVRNENLMQLPPEIPDAAEPDAKDHTAAGGETVSDETRDARDEAAVVEVLAHLRAATGHDFKHYKRATVLRRIARRMQVNSKESIPEYLKFLRIHPMEARALFSDLLIGVTHFFRDQAAFAALEANVPQLFAGKNQADQLRVWVIGCATGEEAYSVAMLLCEQAERLEQPPTIQVFATDLDDQAVHDARDGVFPLTIEADVTQERLRRFFNRNEGHYRVKKELREKVLFAAHDVLRDPPFSRIELITCRNLLIYLNPKAQEQVFDLAHFALRPGGLLFIGGSETAGNMHALFSPLDSQHRLYVRRAVPRPVWQIPSAPPRALPPLGKSRSRLRSALPPLMPVGVHDASDDTVAAAYTGQERRAALFGELHLKLLEQYGPPSAVVNETYDIIHLSESAGRYLQFGGGEPSANILKVVHPALRVELRTALFRTGAAETARGVAQPVQIGDTTEMVSVHVRKAGTTDAAKGFYLVTFEKQQDAAPAAPTTNQPADVTRDLEMEVQTLKQQLATTVENYEAANEELKASNEELQAVNEEMRSTAEELETSKEELQSVNEELVTVNSELKSSVEDLSRTNADLNNLMSATHIATVFLDRQLRIQRFTPATQRIFNLIPADMGRPLSDITHKLQYEGIIDDAHQVLDELVPIEKEVKMGGEAWFLTRVAPFRTADDRIAGVVVTFVDITRRRKAEDELRQSEDRLRRAFEIETVGVLFFRTDGRIVDANDAFLNMSGYTRDDLANGLLHWDSLTPPEFMKRSRQAMEEFRRTGWISTYERQYIRKDGTRWWGLFSATQLNDEIGVKYVLDISDRKEAQRALEESEVRFRQFADNSADVFWILNAETLQLEYVNPVYEEMFGQPRDEIMRDRQKRLELVPEEDRGEASSGLTEALGGKTFLRKYRIVRPTDGKTRWIRDTGFPIRNEEGEIHRVAGVAQDVTEDRERTEALQESEERFRLLVEGAREYAIFMVDPANMIVHWNSGAERVFGWTSDEAVGKSGEIIFTPEDRAQRREQKEMAIARRDGAAPDRRWHLRKDGSRIWVDGIMHRLDNKEGELRGYAKVARDATEQRKAQEELQRAHDELENRVQERTSELQAMNDALQGEIKRRRVLEREILQVIERERVRISQDLHDSLCQDLAATAFLLHSRAKSFASQSPEAKQALEDAAQTVNSNAGVARDLARGLHPFDLSGGLPAVLRELCARTQEKISCVCDAPQNLRLDENITLNLYRIAQEAVTNALKHSKAKEIRLGLVRQKGTIVLSVHDNGKGQAGKLKPGMGLHMMEYRAKAIGGELEVSSKSGEGTVVTCRVPVTH